MFTFSVPLMKDTYVPAYQLARFFNQSGAHKNS